MEGKTIYKSLELETIECCACHIVFAVPKELNRQLFENHKDFYCPVGHAQHYTGKSNLEKWIDYASSIEKQLNSCKKEGNELYKEIKKISDENRELHKKNHYLKASKTRYKNKLKTK